MSTTKTPISLLSFFIYNSTYGQKEGDEHKKILYYYPSDADLDTKIRSIGLCEAMVKFTETFNPDKPCESLHTQKSRQLFLECEKDFWIIMTVSIPYSHKVKDGQNFIEYNEDDVQDSVFQAVLKQAYEMFKLFMGTFSSILKRMGDVIHLKQRLEHFFSRYLLTLKLCQSDLLDVFHGIQFLPLDKNTYLRIQCFINLILSSLSQIKYTAFLYNDQLVWSCLEQEDMQIMYKYLTTSLLPAYQETEIQAGQNSPLGRAVNAPAFGTPHYGKFITGPPNVNDTSNPGKVPRIFVNTENETGECHLLVYKALSATICLMVDGSYPLNFDFYRKVDGLLGPQLTNLASDIGEQYSKKSTSTEPQYKYLYFNHMNLAQKSTIHIDNRKTGNLSISAELMKLLADINSDLNSMATDGETVVKTMSDCWVVGKMSDQREFYVVLSHKNANLMEINEEVKKLCSTHFNNIFILD